MKLKVMIIGAGMYVCGRGTDGYGTVLPALYEAHRSLMIERIAIVATSAASIKALQQKNKELEKIFGFSIPLHVYSESKSNPQLYKKVLKDFKPDATVISVPDHLHSKIAVDVLNAGSHVLVVKPLAPTLKEGLEMVQAAQKSEKYAAVEFHKRFDDANLKIRDSLSQGKLGDVLYVHVGYSQRKIIPTQIFRNWVSSTNIFQYLGVHYVDLIYFLTGARPLRVLALGQKNWLKKQGIDTYDSIQVVTQWCYPQTQETFTSTILTNWIDPNATSAMSDQAISIVGTKGRIDSDQKNRGVQIVTDDKGIEDINPYFSQIYRDGNGQNVFRGYGERSIRQFFLDVHSLLMGIKTLNDFEINNPTFMQSLVSTLVIDAANRSLEKNGAWIDVDKL